MTFKKAKKENQKMLNKWTAPALLKLLSLIVIIIIFLISLNVFTKKISSEETTADFNIVITEAWHLDQNKEKIKDIYRELRERDQKWSPRIYVNDYIRVKFNQPLNSSKDITIWALNENLDNTTIEVYYTNGTQFAAFPSIMGEREYKIFLTNLSQREDLFDLKVSNSVTNGSYIIFDFITDPDQTTCGTLSVAGTYTLTENVPSSSNCFNISAPNIEINCQGFKIDFGNASTGLGINNSEGYDNVSVKNCYISKKGNADQLNYGLYFNLGALNATALNNTIFVNGSAWSIGIYFDDGVNNSFVINNTIYTNGSGQSNRGVRIEASYNITIEGNVITTYGDSFNHGVDIIPGSAIIPHLMNITIRNNSITTGGTQGSNFGINMAYANNITITGNKIYTGGTDNNYGLYFDYSNSSRVENNTIMTNGSANSNIGVFFNPGSHHIIRNNNITTNGTDFNYGIGYPPGLFDFSSGENYIENNMITTNAGGTNNGGVFLNEFHSFFVNNNISTFPYFAIFDASATSNLNYLIYNNSFGEIRWTNNRSTNGFVDNLTFNVTNELGISLSANLFIANNTIAFNTTAFSPLTINATANLTFFNLLMPQVVRIMKVGNFSNSASFINENGANCNGTSCTIISYDNTTGVLIVNASSLSSYSANLSVAIDSTAPQVTLIGPANTTNFSTEIQPLFEFSIFEENIGVVIFSMSNASGTPFNITAIANISGNWNRNIDLLTLTEGSHLLTVFANDTSNNLNNTFNLYFGLDRTPPNVTINVSGLLTPITIFNNTNFSENVVAQYGMITFNATVIDGYRGVLSVNMSFDNASRSAGGGGGGGKSLNGLDSGGTPFNRTAVNFSGNWNISFENISLNFTEGLHKLVIMTNDFLNNTNRTTEFWFSVDRSPPNVSLTAAMLNNSNYSDLTGNFHFNVTVIDGVIGVSAVNFSLTNASDLGGVAYNRTGTNVSGDLGITFTDTNGLYEGLNRIKVMAYDRLNHTNLTTELWFGIDRTVPNATFNEP